MDVISVKSIIDSDVAISTAKGTKLYKEMKRLLDQDQDFSLDFSGLRICGIPFLSFSFGQLLANVDENKVLEIVDNILNLDPVSLETLDIIIENYQEHSSIPPERVRAISDKMTESMANGNRGWLD